MKNLILKNIQAKNEVQKSVLSSKENLIVEGSAGTGKTFLLVYKALKLLHAGEVETVKILRSAVSTRELGFLPGKYEDKIEEYSTPYKNILEELYGDKAAYKKVRGLEFHSTSFVRGTTMNNSFIIVDEMQNLNFHELDSIITRVGLDSKIAFCGDILAQSDLFSGNKNRDLEKFINILLKIPSFSKITFKPEHVVRSGLVKDYLMAKEQYEHGNNNK